MNGKWKLRTVELPCEARLDDLDWPQDRGSAFAVPTNRQTKHRTWCWCTEDTLRYPASLIERSQSWDHFILRLRNANKENQITLGQCREKLWKFNISANLWLMGLFRAEVFVLPWGGKPGSARTIATAEKILAADFYAWLEMETMKSAKK